MDDFEDLRALAHKESRDRMSTILTEHLKSLHYSGVVQYSVDYSKRRLTLYSQHPGWLIGKGGCDVEKLERILSTCFNGKWCVNFVEVHGHCSTI